METLPLALNLYSLGKPTLQRLVLENINDVETVAVPNFHQLRSPYFLLSHSAQELELEDTQSRLQQDLRHRMATEGNG